MIPDKLLFYGHLSTHIGNGLYKVDKPYLTKPNKVFDCDRGILKAYVKPHDDLKMVEVLYITIDAISVISEEDGSLYNLMQEQDLVSIHNTYEFCFPDENGVINIPEEDVVESGKDELDLSTVKYPEFCEFRRAKCTLVEKGIYSMDKPILASKEELASPNLANYSFGIECVDDGHFLVRYIAYNGLNKIPLEEYLSKTFGVGSRIQFYENFLGEQMSFGWNDYYTVKYPEIPAGAPKSCPDEWSFKGHRCDKICSDIYRVREPFALDELTKEDDYIRPGFIGRYTKENEFVVYYISKWHTDMSKAMAAAYFETGDEDFVCVQTVSVPGVHELRGHRMDRRDIIDRTLDIDIKIATKQNWR